MKGVVAPCACQNSQLITIPVSGDLNIGLLESAIRDFEDAL